VEGSAKNGYTYDRLGKKRQSLRQITRHTLLRLRRLTWKKITNRLASLIYKKATLLVVLKRLDQPPQIEIPGLSVECRPLNSSHTRLISELNGLSKERIATFFAEGARCLGAFYNNQLIAYSWCHYQNRQFPFFSYCLEVKAGIYIGPNYVDTEFRGNRIHGFLLTKIFELLYKEGCRQVWSSVLINNHASIKGLKSTGFIPQKQIEVSRILNSIARQHLKELNHWP
jgi:RimJ/RimL family protein N-acetyltransferase